jgi:putative transposase
MFRSRCPSAGRGGVQGLGILDQGYYTWLKNPISQRDCDDAHLINAALDIHADDLGYGYRFIADELAEHGIVASENRVWRLCSTQRIFSVRSKKRGLNRKPGSPVHDDLLKVTDGHGRPAHDFTADAQDSTWLTDTPSTPPSRGSCICVRSRTATPTGSCATPSTRG